MDAEGRRRVGQVLKMMCKGERYVCMCEIIYRNAVTCRWFPLWSRLPSGAGLGFDMVSSEAPIENANLGMKTRDELVSNGGVNTILVILQDLAAMELQVQDTRAEVSFRQGPDWLFF